MTEAAFIVFVLTALSLIVTSPSLVIVTSLVRVTLLNPLPLPINNSLSLTVFSFKLPVVSVSLTKIVLPLTCCNLPRVTLLSIILPVETEDSANLRLVTDKFLILSVSTELADNFSPVTLRFNILLVEIALSSISLLVTALLAIFKVVTLRSAICKV